MEEKKSNSQILTSAHEDFAKGLTKYVHLKIRDVATGDDLVQSTFMKTWIYLQKKGNIDIMRAFLYHVLNNLIIDEYRKHKPVSLDILSEDGIELAVVNNESIFNIIDGKAVMGLIDKLPQPYKDAIDMRFIQELSLREMAAKTNKSQNTMAVRVHRGLVKLKLLHAQSILNL